MLAKTNSPIKGHPTDDDFDNDSDFYLKFDDEHSDGWEVRPLNQIKERLSSLQSHLEICSREKKSNAVRFTSFAIKQHERYITIYQRFYFDENKIVDFLKKEYIKCSTDIRFENLYRCNVDVSLREMQIKTLCYLLNRSVISKLDEEIAENIEAIKQEASHQLQVNFI